MLTGEPRVLSAAFLYDTSPHRIQYQFDQNVSSSLSVSDLFVRKHGADSARLAASNFTLSYDAATNVATFTKTGNGKLSGDYEATLYAEDVLNTSSQPLASTSSFDFFWYARDVNHDRYTTQADVELVAANQGHTPATFSAGDTDYSGEIDEADSEFIEGQFGLGSTFHRYGQTLSVFALANGQQELQWDNDSGNATGYAIQRSTDGKTFTNLTQTALGVTGYIDTSAQASVAYWYRIRALLTSIDAAKEVTAYSSAKRATSGNALVKPGAISVSNTSGRAQALSWTDTNSGAASYEVWQSKPGGGWTFLGSAVPTNGTCTFTSDKLGAARQYDYRIRAVGSSGVSQERTASLSTLAGVPTVLDSFVDVDQLPHRFAIWFDQPVNGTVSTSDAIFLSLTGGASIPLTNVSFSTDRQHLYASATMNPPTSLDVEGVWPEGYYELTIREGLLTNTAGQYPGGGSAPGDEVVAKGHFIIADMNNDAKIDFADLLALSQHYGSTAATYSQGNVDYSGMDGIGEVGFPDLLSLSQRYNVAFPAPPTAPGQLVVQTPYDGDTYRSLQVNWSAPDTTSDYDGFDVFRSTNGTDFTKVARVADPRARSYVNDGLTEGKRYWYRVRSYKDVNQTPQYSYESNKMSATTVLPMPFNLNVRMTSRNTASIGWEDESHGESSFVVERIDDGLDMADPLNWTSIGTAAANVTSITDPDVTVGERFTYRVRALTAQQTSAPAMTNFDGVLAVASDLAGQVTDAYSGHVTWTYPEFALSTISGFFVERSTDGVAWSSVGNFSVEDAHVGQDECDVADIGLEASTTYRYRVAAVGTDGWFSDRAVMSSTSLYITTPARATASITANASTINEGGSVQITLSASNIGSATRWLVDWGDNRVERLLIGQTTANHTYRDGDADYSIVANVAGVDTTAIVIHVNEVTPSVIATGATSMVEGGTYNLSVALANVHVDDNNRRLVVDWGDGSDPSEIASVGNGTQTFQHGFAADTSRPVIQVMLDETIRQFAGTPIAVAITPRAPDGLAFAQNDGSAIALQWQDHSDVETGFAIERSIDNGTTWLPLESVGSNTTRFSTNQVEGTSVRYHVRALGATLNSAYSAPLTVVAKVAGASEMEATAVTVSSVTLHWVNNSANETGFRVERSVDGVSWTTAATPGSGALTTTITSLAFHTTYYFRIFALGTAGDSLRFSQTTATTRTPPVRPERPTALISNLLAPDEVSLEWQDHATNAIAYGIQRRDGLTGDWSTIDTLTGATLAAYTDETTEADHTYYYRVIAISADATSDPSEPKSVTTSLQAPTDVTATPLPSGEVRLDWTDQSPNETSFDIYRTLDGGVTRQLILTVPAHESVGSTQAVVGDLAEGQSVGFFVAAATADRSASSGGTNPTNPRQDRLKLVSHTGTITDSDPYSISVEPHGLTGAITWKIDWGDTNYQPNAQPYSVVGGVYTFRHDYAIPVDGLERRYGLVVTAKTATGKLVLGPTIVGIPASAPQQNAAVVNLQRKVVDAFEFVYNNIKYEAYSGVKKGPTATEETRGGNDWDQAALLKAKILNIPGIGETYDNKPVFTFKLRAFAIDRRLVERWLGFSDAAIGTYKAQMAALSILQIASQGMGDPTVHTAAATLPMLHENDKFAVWQAYLHVTLPPAGIDADFMPAWKFRDANAGIAEIGSPTGVPFDFSNYLQHSSMSPADAYSDEVADHLRTRHSTVNGPLVYAGKNSLSDVAPRSQIREKHFKSVPSGPPVGWEPYGFPFQEVWWWAGQSPAEMRLEKVPGGDTPSGSVLDYSNQIAITFNGHIRRLHTDEIGADPVTIDYSDNGIDHDVKLRWGKTHTATLGTMSLNDYESLQTGQSVPQRILTPLTITDIWVGRTAAASSSAPVIPVEKRNDHVYNSVRAGDPLAVMVQAEQISRSAVATQWDELNKLSNAYAERAMNAGLKADLLTNYERVLLGLAAVNYASMDRTDEARLASLCGVVQSWLGVGTGLVIGVRDEDPERFDGISNPYVFYDVAHSRGITYDLQGTGTGVSTWVVASPPYPAHKGTDQTVSAYDESSTTATSRVANYVNVLCANQSWLESASLEELTNVDSVSTIKGMMLAKHNANVDFYTFKRHSLSEGVTYTADEDSTKTLDNLVIDSSIPAIATQLKKLLDDYPNSKLYMPDTVITAEDWRWSGVVLQLIWDDDGLPIVRGGIIADQSGLHWGGSATRDDPNLFDLLNGPVRDKTTAQANRGMKDSTLGDPVNVFDGSVYHDETDFELPMPGLTFAFARHYQSTLDDDLGLGVGWTFTYGDILKVAGTKVTWITGNGEQRDFVFNGNRYVSPAGVFGTLSTASSTNGGVPVFRYDEKDGSAFEFDGRSGDGVRHLQYVRDRLGNALTISFDSTAPTGATRTFSYRSSGALAERTILTWRSDPATGDVTLFDDTAEGGGTNRTYKYKLQTVDSAVVLARFTSPRFGDGVNDYLSTSYAYYDDATGKKGLLSTITRAVGDPTAEVESGVTPGRYRARHEFDYYPSGRAFRTTETKRAGGSWVAKPSEYFIYNQFTSMALENVKASYTHSAQHIDQNGNVTQLVYDNAGMLTKTINPDGSQSTQGWYTYAEPVNDDPSTGHYLLRYRTNEVGLTDFYQYDDAAINDETPSIESGRVTYQLVGAREFDASDPASAKGGMLTETTFVTKRGAVLPATVTVNGTRTTKFDHDPNGNVNNVTDAEGHVTHYEYTAVGQVQSEIRPKGTASSSSAADQTTTYGYDSVTGLMTSTSRRLAAGGISVALVTNVYDKRGNLLSTSVPTSSGAPAVTTTYEYDDVNRRLSQSVAPGDNTFERLTRYFYFDDLVEWTATTFDSTHIEKTEVGHDLAGRALFVSDPTGISSMGYDAFGNHTSTTDALGHTTQFVYDSSNRPIQTLLADGGFAYTLLDGLGRTVAVSTPLNTVTAYGLDPTARATNEYDQNGMLAETTDAAGQVTVFTYKSTASKNRFFPELLQTEFYASPGDVSTGAVWRRTKNTEIDNLGRVRETRSDADGVTRFEYDDNGNLDSTTRYVVDQYTPKAGVVPVVDYMSPDSYSTKNQPGKYKRTTKMWYDVADRAIAVTNPAGETTRTFYDQAGRVTDVIDPRGVDLVPSTFTTVGNDPPKINQSKVAGDYDPKYRTTNTYDPAGALASTLLPAVDNQVASNRDSTSTVYFQDGRVSKTRNARNQWTTFSYDLINNDSTVEDPTNRTVVEDRDGAGQLRASIDRFGRATTYEYDVVGRKTRETLPQADGFLQQADYVYDQAGDLTLMVPAPGIPPVQPDGSQPQPDFATAYTYDALHRVTTVSQFMKGAQVSQIDNGYRHGDLTSVKVYRGIDTSTTTPTGTWYKTNYDYDKAGRQIAAAASTSANAEPAGFDVPADYLWTKHYDSLGQLAWSVDYSVHGSGSWKDMIKTDYLYDNAGRVSSVRGDDPDDRDGKSGLSGSRTDYTYDKAGNQWQVTVFADHFNSSGNVVSVSYVASQTNYDGRGRVTSIESVKPDGSALRPQSEWTRYGYDANGNTTSQIDPSGNEVTYAYDDLDRVQSETRTVYLNSSNSSNTSVQVIKSYGYDFTTGGHVIARVEDFHPVGGSPGLMTEYETDELGRIVEERWFTTPTAVTPTQKIHYTYDNGSRLVSADSDYHVTNDVTLDFTREYDKAGRLLNERQGVVGTSARFTLKYSGYDWVGNARKLQVLNGANVDSTRYFSYDSLGRLGDVRLFSKTATSGGAHVALDYYQSGTLRTVTPYSNATTSADGLRVVRATRAYTDDFAGRLASIASSVLRFDYTFDRLGRIRSVVTDNDVDAKKTYDYFADGQLKQATVGTATPAGYAYDANHNRTDGGRGAAAADNRQATGADGWTYEYDPRGNQTVKRRNNERWEYQYDQRNRLIRLKKFDAATGGDVRLDVAYAYDAANRRTEQQVDADGTAGYERQERYGVDGPDVLLVTDQVGTFKGRYVYGGGADQVLGEQTPADGFRWLVADHEGSIRRVMGLTGGTQRRLDYDAFGQRVASTATGESGALPRHGFTGQQWDAASSLGYYDARYYQADAARFLQADPAKDGTNGYAYAGNDPVNFTDASGLTAGFGRAAASTSIFANPSGYLQDAASSDPYRLTDAEAAASWQSFSHPPIIDWDMAETTQPTNQQRLTRFVRSALPSFGSSASSQTVEKSEAQYDADAQWRLYHDPNSWDHQYLVAIGGLQPDSERYPGAGRGYVGAASNELDDRLTQMWLDGRGMHRAQIFSELHQQDASNQMAAVAFAPTIGEAIRGPSTFEYLPDTPVSATPNYRVRSSNGRGEPLTFKNGVYEVLSEQPISGITRGTQRAAANRGLLRRLEGDSVLSSQFNETLGVEDVITQMRSGRGSLRNPLGTEWHHPIDNPDLLLLLRKSTHRAPELQDVLHPGDIGGFGTHFGG